MFKLEPRAQASTAWTIASPILAVLITAIIGALIFAASGKDPLLGLQTFFWEPIKNTYAWGELLLKATPLLLIALGLAVCFRSNIWNIGAEGQFLLGAITGGWVALQAKPDSSSAIILLVLLAGTFGGMVWAGIVAFLRDRFNTNEILVSLMLVYVAVQLLAFLVYGPWKDPAGYNFPQSRMFERVTLIPKLAPTTRANIGIYIALFATFLIWIYLFRTKLGFAQQVGGLAPAAARYAGFSSRKALWTALLLSGGLAGLAGALEVAGPVGQLTPHLAMGYGFTAIIVAFVGRLHPISMVFSSILLSMFLIGGELAQSKLGLPKSLSNIFQGLLLFSLLACDMLIKYRVRLRRTIQPQKIGATAPTGHQGD